MQPFVRVSATALTVMLLAAACANSNSGPNASLLPAADAERNIRLMVTYDANSDGTVNRDELEEGLRRQFASIDSDHDGRLSRPETQAENDRRYQAAGIQSSPLIDWNLDSFVDFAEFATTARSVFEALDKNHDGKLDPDELTVPRIRGRFGAGGQPGDEEGRGRRR